MKPIDTLFRTGMLIALLVGNLVAGLVDVMVLIEALSEKHWVPVVITIGILFAIASVILLIINHPHFEE